MRTPRWPFVAVALLVLAAVALIGRQRQEAANLRATIVRQRAAARERAALMAENRRLAAHQVSVEELDRLRAERAAVSGLRAELDNLKRRAEAAAPVAAAAKMAAPVVESPLTQGAVPAAEWRNAGAATPAAAFETVLWSSAGGDLDTLGGLLTFDASTRAKAQSIFAWLPANLQRELATPERLMALLTAKDVPLGSAQITATYPLESETKLVTQLYNSSAPADSSLVAKSAMFVLRPDGDRWLLVVPGRVVDRYAAWLQTPPPVPGAGP
jgi:hypothetical protein